MTISRKFILNELRDICLLILAGFAMTYFVCSSCSQSLSKYMLVSILTGSMWVALWKGNSYLSDFISVYISWLASPLKRFLIVFAATIGYTLLAVYLLARLFELIFNFNFNLGDQSTMYFSSIVITVIISLFMHGLAFFSYWKDTAINAERLEKESIAAKYESLKSQVNPHFLFNSFNALTNLVYEDKDKAVKFIKQLSDVYRYVLDTRDREVVSLKEELEFLESYTYLQQIRFGDKLAIQLYLNGIQSQLAPLALQMLIENAIKHNIVSEDDPLHIKIYSEDNFIVVENNLQKKEVLGELSSGVGLENICKRYEFLSDKKVEIKQYDHRFIVKLPMLK
jgi:hypothetical protein